MFFFDLPYQQKHSQGKKGHVVNHVGQRVADLSALDWGVELVPMEV